MFKDLREKLSSKKLCNLILNSDDKEFIAGIGECQESKVSFQGKNVLRYFEVACLYFFINERIARRIACEIAFNEFSSDFCSRTIECFFVLHEDNN